MHIHISFYGLSACMSYAGGLEGKHIIHWAAFMRSAVIVVFSCCCCCCAHSHSKKKTPQHKSTVCCCYCSCALVFIKCTLSAME